jgi:hypothetical protein
MKKLLITSAIFLFGALIIFSACSDKSTKTFMTPGDTTSTEYTLAREDVDSTMADMALDMSEASAWINRAPVLLVDDSVGYDSTSGWHFFTRNFSDAYLNIADADSFRLTALNGDYQRYRDSLTNIFERRLYRFRQWWPIRGDSATYALTDYSRHMHWAVLADSVTTVNGDMHRLWHGQTERRLYNRDVTGSLDNVELYTRDLRNGYPYRPFSGTFVGTLVLDVVRPAIEYHISGTVTVTFYHDHYHVHLVRGDNYWDWDVYYPG